MIRPDTAIIRTDTTDPIRTIATITGLHITGTTGIVFITTATTVIVTTHSAALVQTQSAFHRSQNNSRIEKICWDPSAVFIASPGPQKSNQANLFHSVFRMLSQN
jgi:hypothetical protein